MLRLFIAIALALVAFAPAASQNNRPQTPRAAPGLWTEAGDRVLSVPASISFPRRVGRLNLTEQVEFNRPGEGLDNGLQYRGPDRVWATVYVYYPGLAHTGQAAFATEHAMREHSETQVTGGATRIVAAGGQAGVAVRAEFGGYMRGYASSAAYIKVGRWLVKLRVSGPEEARGEVEATMTALLDGIRFEEGARAAPAAPLELGGCPETPPGTARALPDRMEDITEHGILSTVDGADAIPARNGHGGIAQRFGARWCLSTRARVGQRSYPILRAVDVPADAQPDIRRSVLFAVISDSGTTLEVVRTRTTGRYVVLYHRIGETLVLGSYDAIPSDEQIVATMTGADRNAGRIRVRVTFRRNGDSEVILMTPPPAAAPPTT